MLGLLLASTRTEAAKQKPWIKAAYDTAPFTPGVTHQQNVCEYYKMYHNGTVPLRDALNGLALRPIIGTGEYFPYSKEHGMDPDDPGILVDILDELADRAGFTWRTSFAVNYFPISDNSTYTDNLLWGAETYDVAVSWWDRTVERMDIGITFLEPWNDGSIVLIDKDEAVVEDIQNEGSVVLWNWIRPFDSTVWLLILFTVCLSGWVYQFIEFLQGEREDRTMWQWTRDNFYLSAINFSQNFEYEPKSSGAKIFAVSMTLFALLITATYTANLASLLVVYQQKSGPVESIEQAVVQKLPICTYANTPSHEHIQEEYPRAKLRPKKNELAAFQALQAGECDLLAAQYDNWLAFKRDNRYNPDCDMEWVGRKVLSVRSGFAVKADAGWKCTTFIKDVLNLHMVEMISEGVLERLKAKQRYKMYMSHPTKCNRLSEIFNSRRLETTYTAESQPATSTGRSDQERNLKGASKSPSSSSANDENNASSLTLTHMVGTFVLHWFLMAVAVFVTVCKTYRRGWNKEPTAHEVAKSEPGRAHAISKPFTEPRSQVVSATNPSFDWEGKYAQLSVKDKALVDIIFQKSELPKLPQPPEPQEEEADPSVRLVSLYTDKLSERSTETVLSQFGLSSGT